MENKACPICGAKECSIEELPHSKRIHCKKLGTSFFLGSEICELTDYTIWFRLMNIVTEFLIRKKVYQSGNEKAYWYFVYKEEEDNPDEIDVPHRINLANELKLYPTSIIGRVSRALLNLVELYPNVGERIFLDMFDHFSNRIIFCESTLHAYELDTVCRFLREMEFIDGDWTNSSISISYKGWEKIDQLTKRLAEANQGFIAMSYSVEAKYIMEAFREAISSSGYKAQIISEKEHNHQIVPEMFYEIERSKFMVVDVTFQNYGAYYEAGYAQALGKEVIVCCSEEVFNDPKRKPHFDISQKPIIIWKDVDDLKERLKRRIEATVH